MSDLKHWEDKIKEKRKKTEFRDFVKEISSRLVLNLYKNEGKISRYPITERTPNIDNKEYLNSSEYYLSYNFEKNFFENYSFLLKIVPLQNVNSIFDNENSDFCDTSFGVKNGYLSFVVGEGSENVAYSAFCYVNLTNIYNSFFVNNNCSNIYFGAGITNSYNIFYSKYITDSSNIWFSTNMIGCEECVFCNGLQNQKYCFQNKVYKKQEYFELKKQILDKKNKFLENYNFISKNKAISYLSENTNGNLNIKCSDLHNCHWIKYTQNSRNVILCNGGENMCYDFFDSFDVGIDSNNLYAVCSGGINSNNLYCCNQVDSSSNIYYSSLLGSCSFCIGCIGLKNKSFCILNKQYSKEEWLELADKIFSQMDKDGILGDFFPGSLNPFYFNDTMAYLIDDSFTKEEVEKENYLWRNENIKVDIPENAEIIYVNPPVLTDIPLIKGGNGNGVEVGGLESFQNFDENGNWQINPEILKKVIQDENGNIYKIVKMEYDFLVKYSLPLPEIHWLDRIKLGFKF